MESWDLMAKCIERKKKWTSPVYVLYLTSFTYGAEVDNVPYVLKYETKPLQSDSKEGEEVVQRRQEWVES
jgi:hypothetical protein